MNEDIYDTMLVPKRKRGQNQVVTKHKIRCVLCGNQMNASAKKGGNATTADMRTHSPAMRHTSMKFNFAVGVLRQMRQRAFDIVAAYL